MPKMLVNNVYLRRQERPSAQREKVFEGRLLAEQGAQFLPRVLGQDVGEVHLSKLCTTECFWAITGTGPRDLPVKSGGWGNGVSFAFG